MKSKFPHLKFEQELWDKGFLVAGIDEVGRGSFAGPLMVGAVILKPISSKKALDKLISLGINDSKLLSPARRKFIKKYAQEFILCSLVKSISVKIINEKGVGFANRFGFEKAAFSINRELETENIFFLTDAYKIPNINVTLQKNIIRGDKTSISIALASIVAKIERDNFMRDMANTFPSYGFENHKGYGTLHHRCMLQEYGPCVIHRTQFIRNYV